MFNIEITSSYRQVKLYLSITLFLFTFFLSSCHKFDELKQRDSNALTKFQAKDYFEQTASTLKFITASSTPVGTKDVDCSLTENMIIEWEQALEGETEDSYIVEIPIRMAYPVQALIYDGEGHINHNPHFVQMNVSLLINKHKSGGCIHHSIVTTVGSYSSTADSKYGFLSDKSSFSGYQFFSSEEGDLLSTHRYKNGVYESRELLTEDQFIKVDSLGKDIHFRGISFVCFQGVTTKGGDNLASGEDNKCPSCGNEMTLVYSNYILCYHCTKCDIYLNSFIDPENICMFCAHPKDDCQCCKNCNTYPCKCGPVSGPGPGEEQEQDKNDQGDNISICSFCGGDACNGLCQDIAPYSSGFYLITASVEPTTPYGTVAKTPFGNYVVVGVNVRLTATPNSGYKFVGWKSNDVIVSTQNPYSFTATSNLNLKAVFDFK